MKVVNNKIYIIKGETPTYEASIIDKDTGAPFIVPTGCPNPVLEFVVRPGIYYREDDYVMRAYFKISDDLGIHLFAGTEIRKYSDLTGAGDDWDDDVAPATGYENYLYVLTNSSGLNEYRYYNSSNHWVEYNFTFNYTFPYSSTSVMEAKQYKYEITLYGGTAKTSPAAGENPINISYKKPLLDATDFIVGGSLSE